MEKPRVYDRTGILDARKKQETDAVQESEGVDEGRRGFMAKILGASVYAASIAGPTAIATGGLHKLGEHIEDIKGRSINFDEALEEYKDFAKRHDTVRSLKKQYKETVEPELVEKIESGEVRSTLEVVEFFGSKDVVGAEEQTRIEYIQNEIQFKDISIEGRGEEWMIAQSELKSILPGLCAQESRFDNNALSSDKAAGIFQFMPETWEEVQKEYKKINGEDSEPLSMMSLKDQTVAASLHFSNIYKRLVHYSGGELDSIKKMFFKNGGFEKYFLVPLMINSYNAGSKRLSDAVILLASEFQTTEDAEKVFGRDSQYLGFDVFFHLAQIADDSDTGTLGRYSEAASEYVPRIYAFADLLDRKEGDSA